MTSQTKWWRRVQCDMKGLAYDFETRTGTLYMGGSTHCNMSGCIELFEAIDPDVERIDALNESGPDNLYIRKGGEWKAFRPAAAKPKAAK